MKYNVTGMSCAACSAHVEKAVKNVAGVTSVTVNLLTNSMLVEGDAAPETVMAAVAKAGYGASPAQGERKEGNSAGGSGGTSSPLAALEDKETPLLRWRLGASLCFLAVLMYISMGHVMWNWPLPDVLADNYLALGLTEMLLTTVIMVINQKFFIRGFSSLFHGAPNMDTLVALGSSAAYIYSTYVLYAMTGAIMDSAAGADVMAGMDMESGLHLAHSYLHDLYYESAAMILTLITLGKMLESYSKGKTTDALKNLMKLAPKTATILVDGKEQLVEIERVKKEDVFIVRSGESVPVDGVILSGNCSVDESALTGESIPVDKGEGQEVSAATICRSGYVTCLASRVGEDTTLSQIIKMVSDASATKAPIAKIADRVSGVFVPAVIAIALVTCLAWLLAGEGVEFALARGISVLVISCPCALGLATPVAIMVGSGKGAGNGILFKTAASLEAAGKTEIVAMDKTGTLTVGTPQVTDILPANGTDASDLIRLACSLEAKSEHPLARAVMEYAGKKGVSILETENFTVAPGNGLSAEIRDVRLSEDEQSPWKERQDITVTGGNLSYITQFARIPEDVRRKAEECSGQGKTPLYFAAGDELLGVIAVADVIRDNAAEVIEELHHMGIRVVMITGDNARTARAIGEQIGVDQIISDVLPAGKEEHIRALTEEGRVAMVGDGINDAPALTRADTGIAIGAGTDVAIDAADVVLVKSNLRDIPAAIRLSRRVIRNIHENLFWAFFYNVIGIPLAAGVWIPLFRLELSPMFGAAAMSLSSFCVVSNALRLNLVDIYSTKKDKKKKKDKEKKKSKEEHTVNKTMKIKGMMCGHCEATVKKALEAVEGVAEARVSHEQGTAIVTLSKDVPDALLKQSVEDKDYQVISIS